MFNLAFFVKLVLMSWLYKEMATRRGGHGFRIIYPFP